MDGGINTIRNSMLLGLFLVLNFLIFNAGVFVLAKNHLICFSVETITNEGLVVQSCTYGREGSDKAKALIQIGDGYGLVGDVENPEFQDLSAWFIKKDPFGDALWIQKYHWGWMIYIEALTQTPDGDFALAGRTLPSGGKNFMWLVKTDANGTNQWLQTYEEPLFDSAIALVQNKDDGFSLAGSTSIFEERKSDLWLVRTDTNGSVQQNQTYGGSEDDRASALIQTTDGGFALVGVTNSFGTGKSDIWIVKTDINGLVEWNQTYGGSEDDSASALIQTTDGGFILAGTTDSYGAGGSDMWLVKTDAIGTPQWNYTYGGKENEYCNALIETADGGFTLAGSTRSVGTSGDMCLIKTNGNGTVCLIQTHGGPSTEFASAVIETLDGHYVIAGTEIWSTPGREKPTSSDIWLIKTAAFGNSQWDTQSTTVSSREPMTSESSKEKTIDKIDQFSRMELITIILAFIPVVIYVKRKKVLGKFIFDKFDNHP